MQLDVVFSLRRHLFKPRWVHMRPVLDQVVLVQAVLRIACIIIPLSLSLFLSTFFNLLKPIDYVMHQSV